MKRYALFAGDRYYPIGGWDDFAGTFDSVEEARAEALVRERDQGTDWHQIVDLTTGEYVPVVTPAVEEPRNPHKRFTADYLQDWTG